MLTPDGPKVIEYNCRFGDPETQVVLALLKSDLLSVMQAVTESRLGSEKVEFSKQCAACVIMASEGYPSSYKKGFEVQVPDDVKDHVLFAGVRSDNGMLLTSGGRVLGVTAVEDTLKDAIRTAYERTAKITFENAYYRKDIGERALKALEE